MKSSKDFSTFALKLSRGDLVSNFILTPVPKVRIKTKVKKISFKILALHIAFLWNVYFDYTA